MGHNCEALALDALRGDASESATHERHEHCTKATAGAEPSPSPEERAMNAIALLKADHREIEDLFEKIEILGERERGKKSLVDKIIRALTIHSSIEERFFYPEVKRSVADTRDEVLDSLEEHAIVAWLCDTIATMDVDDERYDSKLRVLMDTVRSHVEEEESVLFPHVREALEPRKLNELGSMLEKAKKLVPSMRAPSMLSSMGAGVIVRARDASRAGTRAADGRRAKTNGRAASTKRGARATHARA
jgi:hemerythrin superfamily protein